MLSECYVKLNCSMHQCNVVTLPQNATLILMSYWKDVNQIVRKIEMGIVNSEQGHEMERNLSFSIDQMAQLFPEALAEVKDH